jgi:hypothetical protein
MGGGIYRLTLSGVPESTLGAGTFSVRLNLQKPGGGANYQGDGVSSLYIWGAQLEQLPFATPYIPTTTAPVARLGAIVTFPYAENFPGSLKDKTVVFDVNVVGTSWSFAKAFYSGDLRMLVSWASADNDTRVYMAVDSDTGVIVKTGAFRFGMTYSVSTTTLRMYHDGVLVAEDTTATAAHAALTLITIGHSGAYLKIKNLRIYDKTLTENQMRIL